VSEGDWLTRSRDSKCAESSKTKLHCAGRMQKTPLEANVCDQQHASTSSRERACGIVMQAQLLDFTKYKEKLRAQDIYTNSHTRWSEVPYKPQGETNLLPVVKRQLSQEPNTKWIKWLTLNSHKSQAAQNTPPEITRLTHNPQVVLPPTLLRRRRFKLMF
jgi:hypothetical protein